LDKVIEKAGPKLALSGDCKAILGDPPLAPEDRFDQEYINKRFDFAYETARNGYPGKKFPLL
jgi:hypothetical protein